MFRGSLDNLITPAASAQIASANAAVAQAELALENLITPATPAQIASANAAVAQAELALENLITPATPAQIASANAAVAQAEVSLTMAQGSIDTAWASRRIARGEFCDRAALAFSPDWIFRDPICPAHDGPLTDSAIKTLQQMMFTNDFIVTEANSLLNANQSYQSAVGSSASATESLKSAQEQRAALDDPPTAAELAQATESLKSAQEQRAALDDLPTAAELAQATESLKSAQEQRAALDDPPTAAELAQVDASLESARASLETALATRSELIEGPSAGVLMFGDVPAWREFRDGMTPGEDVKQLKQNLIALGYGSIESLQMNQNFDAETADAIKKMQAGLGLVASGRIAFGDIVFLPGTSVVESSLSFPNLGTTVNLGTILVSLLPIERIETQIGQSGDISITTESLQRVMTSIEVADQDLIDVGSEVRIELPDESVVSGTVREIGNVAVIPQGGQAGDPYFEVSVAIDGNANLFKWTGAPVIASVTKRLADDVLAAPVTSLLALLGGGIRP